MGIEEINYDVLYRNSIEYRKLGIDFRIDNYFYMEKY